MEHPVPYSRNEDLAIRLSGNIHGLKASPLRRLERLANRRAHPHYLVSPELARSLTEISAEVQRQVGVLIDRRGQIRFCLVGDARSLFVPDLSAHRRGMTRLCGLRLVHTHLNGEPLNDDDLTDLALLRLDAVAAVEVLESGLPGRVHAARLLPDNEADLPWEVLPPVSTHALRDEFLDEIDALEEEFARVSRALRADDHRDRAILIHVSESARTLAEDSLAELRELARSAGIVAAHEVIQRRPIDPRYVVGRGRLQQTVIKAMQLGASALVFDLNLTPAQVQSLATYTDLKVLDRTQVILDIFAQHAQTREGKIQVELAQLRYLLPRLGAKQSESAFSRLTGGIGGRGPGETKLEIDRRRAQDRVAQLEREVGRLGDRRRLRRSLRSANNLPIISIVGYTNAGKSTLLSNLTRSEVTAENKLFATLNPVSRRLRFPREREVIITDTVGFIRNLPRELLAAFRATLEELNEADLLLHVLDASDPHLDEHRSVVQCLLEELQLNRKNALTVLNKIDRCDADTVERLAERHHAVPVCAERPETFGRLMRELERRLWDVDTVAAGATGDEESHE